MPSPWPLARSEGLLATFESTWVDVFFNAKGITTAATLGEVSVSVGGQTVPFFGPCPGAYRHISSHYCVQQATSIVVKPLAFRIAEIFAKDLDAAAPATIVGFQVTYDHPAFQGESMWGNLVSSVPLQIKFIPANGPVALQPFRPLLMWNGRLQTVHTNDTELIDTDQFQGIVRPGDWRMLSMQPAMLNGSFVPASKLILTGAQRSAVLALALRSDERLMWSNYKLVVRAVDADWATVIQPVEVDLGSALMVAPVGQDLTAKRSSINQNDWQTFNRFHAAMKSILFAQMDVWQTVNFTQVLVNGTQEQEDVSTPSILSPIMDTEHWMLDTSGVYSQSILMSRVGQPSPALMVCKMKVGEGDGVIPKTKKGFFGTYEEDKTDDTLLQRHRVNMVPFMQALGPILRDESVMRTIKEAQISYMHLQTSMVSESDRFVVGTLIAQRLSAALRDTVVAISDLQMKYLPAVFGNFVTAMRSYLIKADIMDMNTVPQVFYFVSILSFTYILSL